MKQPQLTIYSREIIPIVYQFGAQGYGVVKAVIDMFEADSDTELFFDPYHFSIKTGADTGDFVKRVIDIACITGIFSLAEDSKLTCPFMQPWWEYRTQLSQQRSEYGSRKAQPEPKTAPKEKKERQPSKVDRSGFHLLEDSPLLDPDKFLEAFWAAKGSEKYRGYDVLHYHEAAINWSSNGNKKKDWVATVRNFILTDIKKNQARKAKVDAPFRHQQNRSTVDAYMEANR